ncbi:hypothetical protein OGM63_24780 [Plectonema radiosum NIES-515]|uniref:Uncharacterized protein n=1 Tax=Plectonema radiosum NIES-515 TaxID=2986073 RepID=A0ABT3B5S3_9CYAN|nr:hypothetical protein [Plectonema radiosum]MCV3216679.1 hypothetical protein [Plectonema radiosum NIES-515]
MNIDPVLRLHADWLCDIALIEQRIEKDIAWLLTDDGFKIYNQIFDLFGFGLRVRSRLLSRIYPFEAFLSADGKPLIEHEVREVKKVEKERRDGVNVIKAFPGDIKRRDAFKMRIGMGTVLEQSGDELIEKASGSALCRMALWQYVLCQVETGKLKPNSVTKRLLDYKDSLKNLTTPQGKQLLNGKHLQGKLMAKVANMLFDELVTVRSRTQLTTN